MNLAGIYEQICVCITSLISLVVLTYLLWKRLRMATLCALAVAAPCVFMAIVISGHISKAKSNHATLMDRRVGALREVLFGIRVVKSYAWEGAMEEKVNSHRRQEVEGLAQYFKHLGLLMGLFITFPRALVLAGLWGYSAIYGHQTVANIFASMVVLSSLRSMCALFAQSLDRCINIAPSIQRIISEDAGGARDPSRQDPRLGGLLAPPAAGFAGGLSIAGARHLRLE
eukprot:CAMPEP_0180629988 /NCGR_PEP_ID=MMETSP1037_2-20121125/39753_1 /TAXON_ID=632150 /ORGANISM="Azadinium spinosum, Strain 3D9" /LENGTH=227 /DNA_ID=CAMNT_0022650823 /DNA_START=171 /DNA_END=851 /DNA_ORIENTATION=+